MDLCLSSKQMVGKTRQGEGSCIRQLFCGDDQYVTAYPWKRYSQVKQRKRVLDPLWSTMYSRNRKVSSTQTPTTATKEMGYGCLPEIPMKRHFRSRIYMLGSSSTFVLAGGRTQIKSEPGVVTGLGGYCNNACVGDYLRSTNFFTAVRAPAWRR